MNGRPRTFGVAAIVIVVVALSAYGTRAVFRVSELRREMDAMERDLVTLRTDGAMAFDLEALRYQSPEDSLVGEVIWPPPLWEVELDEGLAGDRDLLALLAGGECGPPAASAGLLLPRLCLYHPYLGTVVSQKCFECIWSQKL